MLINDTEIYTSWGLAQRVLHTKPIWGKWEKKEIRIFPEDRAIIKTEVMISQTNHYEKQSQYAVTEVTKAISHIPP